MGSTIAQSGHLAKCTVFSGGSAMFEEDLGICRSRMSTGPGSRRLGLAPPLARCIPSDNSLSQSEAWLPIYNMRGLGFTMFVMVMKP